MRDAIATANDYVSLTKPRIISLLLLTTVATMFVADPARPGALDDPLDDARRLPRRGRRRRDQPLHRARARRPHGAHEQAAARERPHQPGARARLRHHPRRRSPTVQLALTVNVARRGPAAAGLLGYVFVYTLWLKPRTPQNIVLGGAAGAIPPLVGWAAATGELSAQALWPFAIVFFWTPPHFWALSLLIADDYAKTGVPMLPVVRGENATRRQILGYSGLLAAGQPRPRRHRPARHVLPRLGAPARRRLHRPRGRPAAQSLAPRGPPPVPELARLPGAPLHRDGDRPRRLAPRRTHSGAGTARALSRPRRRRFSDRPRSCPWRARPPTPAPRRRSSPSRPQRSSGAGPRTR